MRKPSEATPEAADPSLEKQEPAAATLAERGFVSEWEDLDAFTQQLPDSDGVPLESFWHVGEISLLMTVLTYYWRDRNDFFVGGNMFIYYSPAHVRDEDFKGPDFFYASGVERFRLRRFWAVWQEQDKFPDFIIELSSPTTAHIDRTTKKELYERVFRTPEYFCFDPDTNQLQGWRLKGTSYQEIVPNARGWLWSEVLHLWVGTWDGEYYGQKATWLRFYDAEGRLILHQGEAEQQRAEAERQRADTEHQRAEALEVEVARLKAQMNEQGPNPEAPK